MACMDDIDVTHVFDLLASVLESFSPLFPSVTVYHYIHLSGSTIIAYITNETLLYRYISPSQTAFIEIM